MWPALLRDPDVDTAAAAGGDEITAAAERLFRHRILSREEEVALFARLQAGDRAARDTIVAHNMRLVAKIAWPLRGRGLDWDDLISHGCLGLLTAIEKFEVTRGWKFSTYATWWVYQAITRGIDEESRTLRLPVHTHEALRRIRRAAGTFATAHGRLPTPAELAAAVGMSERKLAAVLPHLHAPRSLDAPLSSESEFTLADAIADRDQNVAQEATRAALRTDLGRAIERARLTERERQVLSMRFGIGGMARATLAEVGDALGITRERARQIERDALHKLRQPHVLHLLEGYLDGPLELAS